MASKPRVYRGKYPGRVREVGSVKTEGRGTRYRLTLNDGRMFNISPRSPLAGLNIVGQDIEALKASGWYNLVPYKAGPNPPWLNMATEHPAFDQSTLPAIPAGFQDVSWVNDSCPSFLNEAAGLIIFVDYHDEEDREQAGEPRFSLAEWSQGMGETLAASDDFADIVAAIDARISAN